MSEACKYCGLVTLAPCATAAQGAHCPHAPGSSVVPEGPLRGLHRKHYGVIYADPPWAFLTYTERDRGTVPHRTEEAPYDSMTRQELLDMQVSEIAAKDCVLHLWTISSHFDQALALGTHWGFTYKSFGFNWVKTQKSDPEKPKMGMGKWFRQETEISLLFTRGKPSRLSAGVRQAILEPAREHSRKPDCCYERIEALSAGPYCELFARTSRPGWDQAGNQVGKFGFNYKPPSDKTLAEIEALI